MKRALLILGTAVLTALPAGLPIAAHAGDDNGAVAINTKDGKTVWRISMKVTRTSSTVVNTVNLALAYSSCTGCSTYAIAFDVVLDGNNPNVVTPTNVAVAINYQCTDCTSYADATQVIVTGDTPMKFTPQGHKDLADIRHDLNALRHQDYATLDDLNAGVHALAVRLNYVVANELVPAGDDSES
jgi:putative peptide zinc metalloprotease protein